MAQQTLETPEELLHYSLRSVLTMENHSLEALAELKNAAQDKKVKELFNHHADETREQIENLSKVFRLLQWEPSTAPSPATTGIKNQAASLLERSDKKLHDQIALMSAMGNEHFEIASYGGLIECTNAMGLSDASALLSANLEQEVHTSDELERYLQHLMA